MNTPHRHRMFFRCALALALFATGCDTGGGADAPGATGGARPVPDAAGGTANEGGTPVPDAGPHPDAAVATGGLERSAGRMQVAQLRRSIEVVTGGLTWEEDFGNGPVRMLDALGPTMGEPDYLLVTEENLEPSLIVAKFVQDASQRVCTKWVAAETGKAAADRTLVRHDGAFDSRDAAEVRTALRTLQLRFFARFVPEGAAGEAALAPLHELFETAASTSVPGREARDGWLAVCIALMSDPEFVVY